MRETRTRRIYGWRQRLPLAIGVSLSVTGMLTFRTGVTAVGGALLLVGLAGLLYVFLSRRPAA